VKTIRAGIGKLRGRRNKKKKSLLFVVSNKCELLKAVSNLPGMDIVHVNDLNTELLAPGTHAGRMTLFTESAIDAIAKDKLFTIEPVKKEAKVKKIKKVKKVKAPKKKKKTTKKVEVKK